MRRFFGWVGEIFRHLFPYVMGLALLCVWFASERTTGRYYLKDFFVLIVLLGVIFFADSLEVAYSLLRYKFIEQFGGVEAKILQEMHNNENLVYEAREWLVTVLIVAITLMGEFEKIYFPFISKEIGPTLKIPLIMTIQAKTLFSLLFTTLPVLWLAQGPAKRVARDCPQKMLAAGALVWALIKRVGWITDNLGLNKPTEWVTEQLKKSDSFKPEMNLRPSDSNYFLASVQRYGYSCHDLSVHILIEADGSCKVRQRVLYYAISHPPNAFVRWLYFDQAPVPDSFECLVLEAYEGKVIQEADPEARNNEVLNELDYLSSGGSKGRLGAGGRQFKKIKANLSCLPLGDEKQPNHEQYRIDTYGSIPSTIPAFAVLADFTSSWSPGAVKTQQGTRDEFDMAIAAPCYRFSLTIETPSKTGIGFSDIASEAFCSKDLHLGERDRLERSFQLDPDHPKTIHCEIPYPFPGIRYRVSWKTILAETQRSRPATRMPVFTGAVLGATLTYLVSSFAIKAVGGRRSERRPQQP